MSCFITTCDNQRIPHGKYCEIHRTNKKRCVHLECKKSAVSRSDTCIEHGGGKRCVTLGCKKSARGTSDTCTVHGGGKRCVTLGCKKSARGKSDTCVEHGGGKRCVTPDCKKSAQGTSDTCIGHGGGKRCTHPECKHSAAGTSDTCIEHGGGKRCVTLGCNKSAVGTSDTCIEHGGGKRCPHCIDWIDSRSGCSKYDGYCATCFKRVFPDDPRSTIIYQHAKEIQVRNAITEISLTNPLFQGFVHDRPLYTGNCDCTHRRRVDHRKLIGNTMVAVETDERAHQGYDEKDEEIRYDDLYMIHSGKWIFIRFNPDVTKNQKTDIDDRIVVLLEVMERHMERIRLEENIELVEIIKLFY